jgi:hypothetical protein
MGPLFEVGESSHPPIPEEERLIHVVEPPQPPRAESVGSLPDDEEEVESGDDSDVPPDEVFMPPGDVFAARCMAVAYVESLPPFTSPGAAIAEAIFSELPGIHVTLVPSSLGDMYAKFLSEEDRELAILHQPFHLDGATIRLVREEEADRVPCDMQWVALVLVRRVPVEHLSQLNISAALSSFGTVLEVDGACLCGTDYASVRAVVLLKDAQHVPREVLLTRLPCFSFLCNPCNPCNLSGAAHSND